MNFLCQIGLRQIQILGTLDRPLSTSQKVTVVRVSGGSSIGRSRRTSENNAFSCIFRNKVKLTHLFSAKMWFTPPPLAHSGFATSRDKRRGRLSEEQAARGLQSSWQSAGNILPSANSVHVENVKLVCKWLPRPSGLHYLRDVKPPQCHTWAV